MLEKSGEYMNYTSKQHFQHSNATLLAIDGLTSLVKCIRVDNDYDFPRGA